jgi:hypothetical protein
MVLTLFGKAKRAETFERFIPLRYNWKKGDLRVVLTLFGTTRREKTFERFNQKRGHIGEV